MIDNPRQVACLIGALRSSLPILAVMTPECVAMFRKETGEPNIPALCKVTQIHYAGDEGGIVCGFEVDYKIGERALFTSITHLQFDPRSELSREIVGYQKHRKKRLRRAA